MMARLFGWPATLTLLLFAASPAAFAHAILVRSTPADQAIVHTHQVDVALEYNSRIEAGRCTVRLTDLAGKAFPLQMEPSTRPSELKAVARNLANGKYQIHWQVLASDGHITRGNIAFTVAAK
ncbi:MAG: copper resistance CopC family protein [Acidobacteriaceae bacterium]